MTRLSKLGARGAEHLVDLAGRPTKPGARSQYYAVELSEYRADIHVLERGKASRFGRAVLDWFGFRPGLGGAWVELAINKETPQGELVQLERYIVGLGGSTFWATRDGEPLDNQESEELIKEILALTEQDRISYPEDQDKTIRATLARDIFRLKEDLIRRSLLGDDAKQAILNEGTLEVYLPEDITVSIDTRPGPLKLEGVPETEGPVQGAITNLSIGPVERDEKGTESIELRLDSSGRITQVEGEVWLNPDSPDRDLVEADFQLLSEIIGRIIASPNSAELSTNHAGKVTISRQGVGTEVADELSKIFRPRGRRG